MTTQINQLTELTSTSDGDLLLIRENATGVDKKMQASNLRAKATTKDDVGLGDVDNVSAASLRDRSTHTGTQTLSTISDSGTIASQNANSVNIDGGTIDGTAVNATTLTASGDVNFDSGTMFVDASENRVGIGTTSPASNLTIFGSGNTLRLDSVGAASKTILMRTVGTGTATLETDGNLDFLIEDAGRTMRFLNGNTERMRIDSNGSLLVGRTSAGSSGTGHSIRAGDSAIFVSSGGEAIQANRNTNDGAVVIIQQDGVTEGTISVSGTTVSYNGGHLARWSRLADDSKDTSIVKGTVMTNLDAMVEWGDEDNEQLNKMAVSSVEGDPNVAGVFVNWDEDDKQFKADMNIAMTGDMVIRIAQGVTVQRGDLLMSAGDGTAKAQGDDIVRSKTIAKVTSTHVSHTYDDGSYLVPCVLMAC